MGLPSAWIFHLALLFSLPTHNTSTNLHIHSSTYSQWNIHSLGTAYKNCKINGRESMCVHLHADKCHVSYIRTRADDLVWLRRYFKHIRHSSLSLLTPSVLTGHGCTNTHTHMQLLYKDTSYPKHTNRLASCHERFSGRLCLQWQTPVSRRDDEPSYRNELCVCKQMEGEEGL